MKILIRNEDEWYEDQYVLHLFGYVWSSERGNRAFRIIEDEYFRYPITLTSYNEEKSLMYNSDPDRSDLSGAVSLKEALSLVECNLTRRIFKAWLR